MNETQKTEPVKQADTIKTFRSSTDIDNFYRFVNENNLRREAKMIFQYVVDSMAKNKSKKKSRKRKLQ